MIKSKQDFENKVRPLAEKIISYAKSLGDQYRITDAAVSISNSSAFSASVEQGELADCPTGTSWDVSVTLYSGDRVLSFDKNTLDFDTLKKAIDDNAKIIHIAPESPEQRLLECEKLYKGSEVDLDLYDHSSPSRDEMADYAKKMEAAALSVPGIKTVRETSISQSRSYSLTLATNGLDNLEAGTRYYAVTSAIAEGDEGMVVEYGFNIARYFNDLANPEEEGKNTALDAVAKLGASLPDSKKVPVVLSKEAAATFFSSVLSAIDGNAVYRGTTFLKDQEGQQVMNSSITIEDDPRIKRGMSSQYKDLSGMESDKLTYIENGVLKQFLMGVVAARYLGREPIGRSGGTTNVSVLPGKQSKEELISDIEDGIYVKDFNGGTANVNNGVFSRQAYGFEIKNGKITDKAVTGFVVAGNLKEMFMNATIANDTPSLPSSRHSMAVPTTRVDGLTIAGKKLG